MPRTSPLVKLLVCGVTIVGAGAVSLRLVQTPIPGYAIALLGLAVVWFLRLRSGLNNALEGALGVAAQFGEHSYYPAVYQSKPVALILTQSQLLLLSDYSPEAAVRLTIPLRRVEGVRSGAGQVEVRFDDEAGEPRVMPLQMEPESADDFLMRLREALPGWNHRHEA